MADLTPNYALERKRIELEIAQLKLSIQAQDYRLMQLDDEAQRVRDNIAATEKSIQEQEAILVKLSSKENK